MTTPNIKPLVEYLSVTAVVPSKASDRKPIADALRKIRTGVESIDLSLNEINVEYIFDNFLRRTGADHLFQRGSYYLRSGDLRKFVEVASTTSIDERALDRDTRILESLSAVYPEYALRKLSEKLNEYRVKRPKLDTSYLPENNATLDRANAIILENYKIGDIVPMIHGCMRVTEKSLNDHRPHTRGCYRYRLSAAVNTDAPYVNLRSCKLRGSECATNSPTDDVWSSCANNGANPFAQPLVGLAYDVQRGADVAKLAAELNLPSDFHKNFNVANRYDRIYERYKDAVVANPCAAAKAVKATNSSCACDTADTRVSLMFMSRTLMPDNEYVFYRFVDLNYIDVIAEFEILTNIKLLRDGDDDSATTKKKEENRERVPNVALFVTIVASFAIAIATIVAATNKNWWLRYVETRVTKIPRING